MGDKITIKLDTPLIYSYVRTSYPAMAFLVMSVITGSSTYVKFVDCFTGVAPSNITSIIFSITSTLLGGVSHSMVNGLELKRTKL